MKILVMGVAGFIGSIIIYRLIHNAKGEVVVIVMDKITYVGNRKPIVLIGGIQRNCLDLAGICGKKESQHTIADHWHGVNLRLTAVAGKHKSVKWCLDNRGWRNRVPNASYSLGRLEGDV